MVVADLTQMSKDSKGKFNPEDKAVIKTDCVVEADYVDQINKHTETTGKAYEINEDKTEVLQEKLSK